MNLSFASARSFGLLARLSSGIAVSALALAAAGCTVRASAESDAVLYQGSPETQAIAYGPNQRLRILNDNAQITVKKGSGDQVQITFEPFAFEKKDNEAEAVRVMSNNIKLSVTGEGEEIVVQARREGATGSFGAHITVTLPASFSGDFFAETTQGSVNVDLGGTAFDDNFTAKSGNGSIDVDLEGTSPLSTTVIGASDGSGAGDVTVVGAGGQLAVEGNFDVSVRVSSWGAPGTTGYVTAKGSLGDVIFALPANVSGELTALAGADPDDVVIEPAPFPQTWTPSQDNTPQAKAYTMGDGQGARVDITAEESITLEAF